MAIDRFDTGRFEGALPKHKQTGQNLWKFLGMQSGERVYVVPAGEFARVLVRSSIDESGYAAESGNDSIRLWLEIRVDGSWKAMKKMDSYTTRVKGWEGRMVDKMRELYTLGIKVKREILGCEECDNKKLITWFVKKEGANLNRPMAKCPQCGHLMWLDVAGPIAAEDAANEEQEEQTVDDLLGLLAAQTKDVMEQVEDVIDEAERNVKSPDPYQELAILAPTTRPIRVLSPPGGGKTYVIEHRYQFLLSQGASPGEIVVVTFSKAQSQDMAERIMKLNPIIRGTDGESQICTIHAFCNRTLHRHKLGRYIPEKSWEVKRYIQENSKKLWPSIDENDNKTCRPAWDEILNAIGTAKHNFVAADDDYDLFAALWGDYHGQRLSKIRKMFDEWMQGRKEWMFIDMLYDMEWHLVNNQAFREEVQGRFKYIMIDEAQDTNGQAMRILTTVAKPEDRVFVVGDPDQMLYRFAGATPEENCYEGFDERYPDGLTFMLETNYRSTHEVVNRSHDLIEYNYWDKFGPYDVNFLKSTRARLEAEQGEKIDFKMFDNPQQEADSLSDTIVEFLQGDTEPGDIFVSSRTRAQLGVLEPALTEAGVPFINITGGSFWLMGHVQKLMSWPKLVYNHADDEAFGKVVNIASKDFTGRNGEYSPTRFLGRAFVQYCDGLYDRETVLRSSDHRRAWYYGATDFVDVMDELEHVAANGSHVDVMRAALVHYEKHLRYEEGMMDQEQDIGKMADLEVVIDVADQFDTWDEFLGRVQEAIEAARDAKNKNWGKYVVLSTVHRLKGMERPVMFGIGWCESDEGTGLLPHTFSLGTKPPGGVLDMGGGGRIEDERCIGYVCVTRAMDRVFLSGFRNFRKKLMHPSRFIEEMGLVEEWEHTPD